MPKCVIVPIPTSPIDRLAMQFREVMYLPDPRTLYLLMGSVAANMLDGPPVWPMLVGPSSCGKSELLLSLKTIPGTVEAADISGEAAFLSGTPRHERSEKATGGLLKQVGSHGALIVNDFTSVLSKPLDRLNSIMAVFRECYIGGWTRLIGGEGGRSLSWSGKLALYAGVTSKIDQHQQASAELGERWIYWRYERTDGFNETMLVLGDSRAGKWREELRHKVAGFFEDLNLSYGGTPTPRRDFTTGEKLRLHRMASVAVRCRSGVYRDTYNKEINGPAETEAVTRLASVLGQLLVGMDAIGVAPPAAWRTLGKVALDSMPRLRRLIMEAVAPGPILIDALEPLVRVHPNVIKRAVEDLALHDVFTVHHKIVEYTPWMKDNCRAFH